MYHEIEKASEFILMNRFFCGHTHNVSESFDDIRIDAVARQNYDRNFFPFGIRDDIGKDLDPVLYGEMNVEKDKVGPGLPLVISFPAEVPDCLETIPCDVQGNPDSAVAYSLLKQTDISGIILHQKQFDTFRKFHY